MQECSWMQLVEYARPQSPRATRRRSKWPRNSSHSASWVSELPPMTYQTYIKKNPETGQVYAGKTSGRGTPLRNVTQRNYGHAYNKKGFGPAQLDKSSTNEDTIKGREQMLIDYYITLGISGNSDRNPLVNES